MNGKPNLKNHLINPAKHAVSEEKISAKKGRYRKSYQQNGKKW